MLKIERNPLALLFKGPVSRLRQRYNHSTCTLRNWITNSIRGFFPWEELSSNSISINRMITFEPPTPLRGADGGQHPRGSVAPSLPANLEFVCNFHCWHLTLLPKSRSSYQGPSVALRFLFLLLSFSLTERKSPFLLSEGIPLPCLWILTSTWHLAWFWWTNSQGSCYKHSHNKTTIVNKIINRNETERFSPKYTEVSSLQYWKYKLQPFLWLSFP